MFCFVFCQKFWLPIWLHSSWSIIPMAGRTCSTKHHNWVDDAQCSYFGQNPTRRCDAFPPTQPLRHHCISHQSHLSCMGLQFYGWHGRHFTPSKGSHGQPPLHLSLFLSRFRLLKWPVHQGILVVRRGRRRLRGRQWRKPGRLRAQILRLRVLPRGLHLLQRPVHQGQSLEFRTLLWWIQQLTFGASNVM